MKEMLLPVVVVTDKEQLVDYTYNEEFADKFVVYSYNGEVVFHDRKSKCTNYMCGINVMPFLQAEQAPAVLEATEAEAEHRLSIEAVKSLSDRFIAEDIIELFKNGVV